MFGRKRSAAEGPGEKARGRGTTSDEAALLVDALDTVSAFLDALGELAFDLGELDAAAIRARFEAWKRNLLAGSEAEEADAEIGASGPRDWRGAQRFVAHHRRDERDFVVRSLADLREVIWAFIRVLSKALVEGRSADARLEAQVERLRGAASDGSIERLKQEAGATVNLVERLAEERQDRESTLIQELGSRLDQLRSELEEARERMAQDGLTELYNRAAFDEQLGRYAAMGVLTQRTAWLYMVDVDHFKWLNDSFGHPAGDAVLRELARCLRGSFGRQDDFVARFGGEEFGVIIPDAEPAIAERLGERLLDNVRGRTFVHEGREMRITVSVGVARLRAGELAETWLERADRLLYEAKQAGRDRFRIDPVD